MSHLRDIHTFSRCIAGGLLHGVSGRVRRTPGGICPLLLLPKRLVLLAQVRILLSRQASFASVASSLSESTAIDNFSHAGASSRVIQPRQRRLPTGVCITSSAFWRRCLCTSKILLESGRRVRVNATETKLHAVSHAPVLFRFSHATMPIFNLAKNCGYYWGFAAFVSYSVNHPYYVPPPLGRTVSALGLALMCQFANLRCHMILANLRPPGSKHYAIPRGFLFDCVTCANYTAEIWGWVRWDGGLSGHEINLPGHYSQGTGWQTLSCSSLFPRRFSSQWPRSRSPPSSSRRWARARWPSGPLPSTSAFARCGGGGWRKSLEFCSALGFLSMH